MIVLFLHTPLCVFPAYEQNVFLEIKEYTDDTFTTVIDNSNQDSRKTLAGQTIYLSMRGSVPDGYKYAVSDCSIVTQTGSRFLLIEPGTTRATCGMDGIGMTAFYDSGNFNLQHVLFLLEDAATVSSFRLDCNVKICDKTDPNSDCNKAVLPCMDEVQKNEYLCDGFCNEICEVSNDVPVCVPKCRTLHQAAVTGDNDCADSFIDGGNVDTLFEGTSPVYQAVGGGHIDIVRMLIDNGADLNQPAGDDCEILESCTQGGQ